MTHVAHSTPALPSNRSFGLLFTAVFAGLAGYGFFRSGPSVFAGIWLLASVLVAAVTHWAPQALTPLNKAWFRLGALMGRVVNPLVFGLMFFGVITPIGFVTRVFGRDVLRLKPRQVDSYWIDRVPTGPDPESFKNQF